MFYVLTHAFIKYPTAPCRHVCAIFPHIYVHWIQTGTHVFHGLIYGQPMTDVEAELGFRFQISETYLRSHQSCMFSRRHIHELFGSPGSEVLHGSVSGLKLDGGSVRLSSSARKAWTSSVGVVMMKKSACVQLKLQLVSACGVVGVYAEVGRCCSENLITALLSFLNQPPVALSNNIFAESNLTDSRSHLVSKCKDARTQQAWTTCTRRLC